MAFREFHYAWRWHLQSTPERLWPLISDTNRFNRDTGLPPVSRLGGGPLPNARRRLGLRVYGVPIEWEEEPFEWLSPKRFGVVRRYSTGPVEHMRVLADLHPEGRGTLLEYRVWARPRNPLGLVAIPLQVGLLSARRFERAARRCDEEAHNEAGLPEARRRPRLAPGGRERLAVARGRLLDLGLDKDLVGRLVEVVRRSDDLTLSRIRPYLLADLWGAGRRSVLELCLHATRAGLLDLSWNLLCPLCRGAANAAESLEQIRPTVHCDSCGVDYTVNFDRSVELTFRPNGAVRVVEGRPFCVGGPQVTPHVVVQQRLEAGESRALDLSLEEGRYRFRAPGVPGFFHAASSGEGPAEAEVSTDGLAWPSSELLLGPACRLTLANRGGRELLILMERTAWTDQAATAAEVIVLQVFRDLFAGQALRPGERIDVGSTAILFTDLRGSTRFYREVGDAVAFGRVMDHFDVLKEAIAGEGGSLVKTIGDSVMAAFRRPVGALRAMARAQALLSRGPEPLMLKAGVHVGPCIAVTLNGRLDYFGTNVNLAARLEGLSSGGDVVVSEAVMGDPEVKRWLAECGAAGSPLAFEAALKGFDEGPVRLWRVPFRLGEP